MGSSRRRVDGFSVSRLRLSCRVRQNSQAAGPLCADRARYPCDGTNDGIIDVQELIRWRERWNQRNKQQKVLDAIVVLTASVPFVS